MKNKKGFTLVELLGVIILIGLIILAISSPIISLINSNSQKLDEASLKLLYTTVEQFMDKDSRTYVKTNNNIYYISLEQLINSGDLDESFFESYSKEVLSKNTQIKITVNNGKYNFEIPENKLSNISEICNDMDISNTYNYNGGTYIKGDSNNNYVLFNGLIFRIMGVNADGTIRLIMDESATSLSYTNSSFNYDDSYVREWLNDYFISRLQHNSIIEKQRWYFKAPADSTNIALDESTNVLDKVGLLSIEEFNLSLLSNQSYLINNTRYGFINMSDNKMYVSGNNQPYSTSQTGEYFVYPIINVLSSSVVTSGDGTKNSPYVLSEVLTTRNGQTLKDANLFVGDYLNIDSKMYRVVEKNDDNIKIISYYNTELYSKYADVSNTFNVYNGAGSVLNTSITNSKFLNKDIFIGEIYASGNNYKNTVFLKKNLVSKVKASLPVMGEILTGNLYEVSNKPACYWTLNLASTTSAYQICNNSIITQNIDSYDGNNRGNYGIIFVTYIDSNNVITSGNGTFNSPYKI